MLTAAGIRETLSAFVEEESGNPPPPLDGPTPLREGLGLDSLDVVGVVMKIEEHYRIRLEHAELEKVVTVDDLTGLIMRKVEENGAPQRLAA